MYFPRNREFGWDLSKLRNFGRGLTPPNPIPRYATACAAYSVTSPLPTLYNLSNCQRCPIGTLNNHNIYETFHTNVSIFGG
jgi:hypothetical protein